jgi:hypothetical protein
MVYGTNGLQFSPNYSNDTLYVYSALLAHPTQYVEDGSVPKGSFKGFDTTGYAMVGNTNGTFMSTVDGTSNLTSCYDAPIFASSGQFYGASSRPDVVAALPVQTGTQMPFPSNSTTGSSWIIVDEPSGTTLGFQTSLQYNFQTWVDNMFTFNQTSSFGQFVPRAFILQTMSMPKSQL